MIHPNSRAAYLALQEAGELQPKELLVLQALEQYGPLTRQELPAITGMPINCITGRVNSLLKKEAIVEDGSKFNERTRKDNALLKLAMAQMDLLEVA
jgi:DNA-binding MarR family transcriptional regulator